MKTLQQIKDEAANDFGYKDWITMYNLDEVSNAIINELCKICAREALEEAASVCREHADSDCFDGERAEANILNIITELICK